MQALLEQYNSIYQKIKNIRDQINEARTAVSNIEHKRDSDIPARVARLKEQIEKIDEYMLKIAGFRKEAEKYLTSKNVQTVEAPPGYRVNLNRLRGWAMMIDPQSTDDPYAQRVNFVARCDELFLSKKKQEFTERIKDLTSGNADEMNKKTEELKNKISALKKDLAQLANSDEVASFAEAVVLANKEFWYENESSVPEIYNPVKSGKQEFIAPGAYALPFEFEKDQRKLLTSLFGRLYDENNSRILLPFMLEKNKEFAISVSCIPAKTRELDRGLQNLILDIINKNPAGSNKVYVIDALRFSSASLGFLKQLENTFALEQLPRNPEQLSATLEQIVSSFSDMDDILELCDSVNEYNGKTDVSKHLSKSIIILFGYPSAYDGRDRDYINRIMTNYERYGISFISISFGINTNEKKEDIYKNRGLPEFAAHNAVYIDMLPRETTINSMEGTPQGFAWYVLKNDLPETYIDSVKSIKIEKKMQGNIYNKRFNMSGALSYSREYRGIDLPFGVDGKDQPRNVQFENENFATYLVGASRSGKSTLLHTLIAGLIRNYHPDSVELWLADFKQLEFKLYIENCPPHVKYVLLDESTELVYDLIDKLTEKMMERQRAFARLGVDKLKDVKYDDPRIKEPMPLIFVILDEFSIMSQAIAENQSYRLRLQNLLAKGAALGIRFLFASQSFTTGIAGLTPTAKAQIQQRIAMKASREEIGETLELSANLKTEQVSNWMDALPPHYALVKYRPGEDALPEVKRVHVLFFPPADRDAMIKRIIDSYEKVDEYSPNIERHYVDKEPVLIDGNTYDAFNKKYFIEYINELKTENKDDYTGDETFMTLGTPRLMTKMKAVTVTPEARENILLVGRSTEQACSAAIISSAIQSYLAQGKKVQIWAYDKNRLFLTYKNSPWRTKEFGGIEFREGIHSVCDAIYETKQKIRGKEHSDELIVLIGIDRICADFEFIEETGSAAGNNNNYESKRKAYEEDLIKKGAVVISDADALTQRYAVELMNMEEEIQEREKSRGKTDEEIAAIIAAEEEKITDKYRKYFEELSGKSQVTVNDSDGGETIIEEEITETAQRTPGEYNAKDDFLYIVKQGSRRGYHFMLYLNSFADLKQTALKLDMFRHRLSFQVSVEDSRELFGNRAAGTLPEHICQYYDSIERYSFRPYLHKDISWEGWEVDNEGKAINPFTML